MVAAPILDPTLAERFAARPPSVDVDQRLVLNGIAWRDYCVLRELLDGPRVRMTYLGGSLELMSPGRLHEDVKKRIARLLELWALECDVPLYGYGSVTLKAELQERGLEPDECYVVGKPMAEVPELAIEVVVTRALVDKIEVYRGLGVREVWRWDDGRLDVLVLGDAGAYEPRAESAVLPGVDVAAIARHAANADQHAALRAFRDEIRAGR